MQAGDHQHMVRSAFLKGQGALVVDEGPVAEQHRPEDGGAIGCGGKQGVHLRQQPATHPRDPMRQRWRRFANFGEQGSTAQRPNQMYILAREIGARIEGAGVAVIPRRARTEQSFDTIPGSQDGKQLGFLLGCRSLTAEVIETQAAAYVNRRAADLHLLQVYVAAQAPRNLNRVLA